MGGSGGTGGPMRGRKRPRSRSFSPGDMRRRSTSPGSSPRRYHPYAPPAYYEDRYYERYRYPPPSRYMGPPPRGYERYDPYGPYRFDHYESRRDSRRLR